MPLKNVYSPEISYNKFKNELILSYWQNVESASGTPTSPVIGYDGDSTKKCQNKTKEASGSVSVIEKSDDSSAGGSGGSVSTTYKAKKKDMDRALSVALWYSIYI